MFVNIFHLPAARVAFIVEYHVVGTPHHLFGWQLVGYASPDGLLPHSVALRQTAQTLVEVDGGVYSENVRAVEEAGVDIAVAGSAVFGAPDPAKAISVLRGA